MMFASFELFSEWCKQVLIERKKQTGRSMPLRDVLQMTWNEARKDRDEHIAQNARLLLENDRLNRDNHELQKMVSRLYNAMPAPIYVMEGKSYRQHMEEERGQAMLAPRKVGKVPELAAPYGAGKLFSQRMTEARNLTVTAPDDARIGANFGGDRGSD